MDILFMSTFPSNKLCFFTVSIEVYMYTDQWVSKSETHKDT